MSTTVAAVPTRSVAVPSVAVPTTAALPTTTAAAAPTVAPVISTAVAVSSQPRTTSTRRHRTTTVTSVLPTTTPYDATAERRADTQRTNRILIGIFSSLGVIVLGLVAFQLFRRYKRRQNSNRAPLPPPRKSTMSQLGYRNSRGVSMYAEFPTPDFSRPPSATLHKGHSFGSASGFINSVHSNAASAEKLAAEDTGPRSAEGLSPGHAARESTSDNSITGAALAANNDEEMGRRLSPLGSRSQSPSGLTPPRPASQAQSSRRPDSRNMHPRPSSVASSSRHAHLNTPAWQAGQRNSAYGAPNRSSYYGNGNRGAPHSPHARERVGLMMPQPLAPELFNYALSGRHDMGLDFSQGAWGSQGNLPKGGDASLPSSGSGLQRARTDSWVAPDHAPLANEGRSSTSDAPPPPPRKDGSLPRGRSSRPEIARP
ncbi:hypothetical protein BDV93DRAFT_543599 [Ceratobasidium sp. AG-I]|nr:hypothetical protein BDV93DRAFT_543599 [Ceratobasidium sp. AG-I]